MARAACCLSFILLLAASPAALALSEEEMFFKGSREVNEGELHFIDPPADRPIHHHHNRITIVESSLDDGWIRLEQCHEHLDPVPLAQIVYHPERIRGLAVTDSRHIEEARVEGNSVQLRGVTVGALLCVRAESRALARDGERSWNLVNGPYMRKFLDGYYPMRVSMHVRFETRRIAFVDITPQAQPGFQVWRDAQGMGYDAVFEGELRTVIRFDSSAE